MISIEEIEKMALDLPESQRARLAQNLLTSLPPVLYEQDEGLAEAILRDAELELNPQQGISLEELDAMIKQRRLP